MKYLNRGCMAFVLVSVITATAYADDPPATPAPAPTEAPAPAPASAPAGPRKFGGVADNPFWVFGVTMPPGVALAAGVSIDYDGFGLADPFTGMPTKDKFGFNGLIYGSYYFYNKFPMGIAAELALVAPLSPKAFEPFFQLQPGVVIYYAPFPAPIVIGAGWDLSITSVKSPIPGDGRKTQVKTLTPGLRIIYAF
jgi:hypothetical protein